MTVSSLLRPEHPLARSAAELASHFGLESEGDLSDVEIRGVSLSSNAVADGDLYVGIPGAKTHGAKYATAAAESGAVAVLTDAAGVEFAKESGLPVIITPDPRLALGEVAAWVYRTRAEPGEENDDDRPTLFGVTGTNGKTSVSYLLDAILRQLGYITGLTSTAERKVGDDVIVSGLTTPEAPEMHAFLARLREIHGRAACIEVSAQAITRNRVDGLVFDVAGFTNLSHDHLDDYANMEEYFQAKAELFTPERAVRGVVSLDSPYGERVVEASRIPVTTIATRTDDDADWRVEILEEHADHTSFRLRHVGGAEIVTNVPLIGRHMAANAAMAIVMIVESGVSLDVVHQALERDGGILAYLPGRTELVSGPDGPRVYVDFGHSPDAFENTLAAVKRFTTGRTIMVFGADGDRDKTKRFDMARTAVEGSDVLVVTDHHPRFEDPASIRATLVAAAREVRPDGEIYEVEDPKRAIRFAVDMADPEDSILWAGPGHQNYREIRGVKTEYSARAEARAALREAGWQA